MSGETDNSGYYAGAFLLQGTNLVFFLSQLAERHNLSAMERDIFTILLAHNVYSTNYGQITDSNGGKYFPEPFQILITPAIIRKRFGYSYASIRKTYNKLSELGLIKKMRLRDGHVKKYFFRPVATRTLFYKWGKECADSMLYNDKYEKSETIENIITLSKAEKYKETIEKRKIPKIVEITSSKVLGRRGRKSKTEENTELSLVEEVLK